VEENGAAIKWWCRQSCSRKRKKLRTPLSAAERASGGWSLEAKWPDDSTEEKLLTGEQPIYCKVPHWKEVLCVWGHKAKWTVKYATKDKKERIDKPARISCQVKTKLFRGLKNFNKLENARRVVWLLRWKFMCWLDFDITIKIYWTVN